MFKKFVVKVPATVEYRLFLHGLLANIQEKRMNKLGRPDLGKVIFCDLLGLFLVMKRYESLNITTDAWIDIMDALEKKYEDDDCKALMLQDLKQDNWCLDEYGNYILIDYGTVKNY